jgi:hypothetical protein
MQLDDLGTQLARTLHWDGDAIFQVMIAALTDANFHTEVKVLEQAWHNVERTS